MSQGPISYDEMSWGCDKGGISSQWLQLYIKQL